MAPIKYMQPNQLSKQIRILLSDGVLFSLLLVVFVICYAMLVGGLSLLFYGVVQPVGPWIPGAVFFLLAVLFLPAYTRAARLLEKSFLRGPAVYRDSIQRYTEEVEQVIKIGEIIDILRDHLDHHLSVKSLHIYYADPVHEQFVASNDGRGLPTSELRFANTSPFVKMLVERQGAVFLSGTVYEKRILQSDRTRLSLLGAVVVFPLQGSRQLLGWVALGEKTEQGRYQSKDLHYIDSMCSVAARAIERTQVIDTLEERVRHLNVLTRISQGINITITRDDILELIYAQTTQLIPASDLSILVRDRTTQDYVQVFCVKDEERLASEENIPVNIQQRLENIVIETQKYLLTNHYDRECFKRGAEPYSTDLTAWLAVPLLSGAEIIGALSIARRDLDGVYTRGQITLLEAIADQVAGALEKSRLLMETERRAQQLSSLNEVSRKLTSNLDFDSLLKNILESAVQILQCESGQLFLADEEEDDLVIKVTAGPGEEELVGKHFPVDRGPAGAAFSSGNPLRVKDMHELQEWMPQSARENGLATHSVLIVPLKLKDRAIGGIQVINKHDQSPFSQDDEELLTAFAAQASISIENARLYTLTDQKLEARVKELSVLQRVGRELNATLDSSQAMEITLRWAVTQSSADAGFIATFEENEIKVMASSGYAEELQVNEKGLLSDRSNRIRELIRSGGAQSVWLDPTVNPGFRAKAKQQIFIPLERENVCNGLLLLELDALILVEPDLITFLQRLVDHASISIANAQLYSAVQRANLAKSEFVSFVSHELKNPMTSIKGYTELIAAGAVGPVNDAQQGFLMTIRSNVDRMAMLVSDLADESRIEAGRLRLDFESVSLQQVFEEVFRSESKLMAEKALTLDVDFPESLTPVWADHTRLVQILANLISNARKYTPEGGKISVQAKTSRNQWDAGGAQSVVVVSIRDNGLGMKPEDQEKIFQKFFRSDDVKTREVTGTGLGLNITKSLVEAQGGKIWFESEFRRGTAFYFTIPMAEE